MFIFDNGAVKKTLNCYFSCLQLCCKAFNTHSIESLKRLFDVNKLIITPMIRLNDNQTVRPIRTLQLNIGFILG